MKLQIFTDNRFYVSRNYLLRWALHYQDGSVWRGHWSDDSLEWRDHVRPGLGHASIEARGLQASYLYSVAECPGEQFVGFRWMRATRVPIGELDHVNEVKVLGQIHGLVLVSKAERMTVRIDGSAKLQRDGKESSWLDVISGSSYRSPSSRPP